VNDNDRHYAQELLAASLRCYAGPGARPGLEGRILAGVWARQEGVRRRAAWAWALGIAVAAVAALLMLYVSPQRTAPVRAIVNAPANPLGPDGATRTASVPVRTPRRVRHVARPTLVDARPQQFPTPRPLSEQEKLLVEYAKLLKASSSVSKWNPEEEQMRDIEIPPLSIAAIQIDPLPTPRSEDEK